MRVAAGHQETNDDMTLDIEPGREVVLDLDNPYRGGAVDYCWPPEEFVAFPPLKNHMCMLWFCLKCCFLNLLIQKGLQRSRALVLFK